ncbi:MAG: (5-formylfuran-3-yl)methyl phosphate synthase [Planctomycetota bacterium]|nr:(5-formylfuran-3-yl)methyl phosphate synthase [Planctomycetota bacterium]
MTKLIVSVRNADEAVTAHNAGADLIDIKEPRNGSLGAPSTETVGAVVREVATARPISVALGDLGEWSDNAGNFSVDIEGLGVRFAKIGLAGGADLSSWAAHWKIAMEQLPADVQHVAVVYADWQHAGAPPPDEIIDCAHEFDCAATLLDTWDKKRGGLLERWAEGDVSALVTDVQSRGMISVVAGSLDERAIVRLRRVRPDYFAVRGAVCAGGRTATLDATLVARLSELIRNQHGGPFPESASIRA